MSIGLGKGLLLRGLIFALGVIDLPVSLDDAIATGTLGWTFIAVGIIAILLSLATNAQRSQSTRVVENRCVDPTV